MSRYNINRLKSDDAWFVTSRLRGNKEELNERVDELLHYYEMMESGQKHMVHETTYKRLHSLRISLTAQSSTKTPPTKEEVREFFTVVAEKDAEERKKMQEDDAKATIICAAFMGLCGFMLLSYFIL